MKITQEDKELLLKDLCARLPYRTMVKCITDYHHEFDEELSDIHIMNFYQFDTKPYLRPMSSMTEDEKRHISKIMCLSTYVNGVVYDMTYPIYTPYYVMEDCLSYLRSIHVDYSGLIEKGLALEAPEGMYDTNIKDETLKTFIKDRVGCKANCTTTKEWGEEDEEYMRYLHTLVNNTASYEYGKKVKRFLKSFRPQKGWKPSGLQIEALESATGNCAYSEYVDCLKELIKQLKQL